MPDPLRPTFRVVGATEPARRKRGPGLAVVATSFYALLFVGALWTFQYSRARARASTRKVEAPLAPPDRPALIAGTGLAGAARQKYLERIGTDHCDCGCQLTLSACLAGDVQCVRSPELARRRLLAAR
jgi:hypothetical protein